MSKNPSLVWYMLPIFLSIVGGLIGYFVFRGSNKRFANRLLVVGVIVMAIGIALNFVAGVLLGGLIVGSAA